MKKNNDDISLTDEDYLDYFDLIMENALLEALKEDAEKGPITGGVIMSPSWKNNRYS